MIRATYNDQQLAVGPEAKGHIDITKSVAWNLKSVSKALGKSVDELTVVILERPRHATLIEEVRACGARIKLISDGDVAAAIATAHSHSGVDIMYGIGAHFSEIRLSPSYYSIKEECYCVFSC
jgi:fructose-1,6-bisphosphatase II